MDLRHLAASTVQERGQEADGDMEDLARDFMAVDLAALVLGGGEQWDQLTKDRHSWWIGIKPSGLGLRLISRQ